MIWYNFATELCMTCGQEGYIHGWQSQQGQVFGDLELRAPVDSGCQAIVLQPQLMEDRGY